MGDKIFRWEDGSEKHETKFNFSQVPEAQALWDWFERIAETEQRFAVLDSATHFDRLGVNQAVLELEATYDRKRLVALAQFLPLLDPDRGERALHAHGAGAGRGPRRRHPQSAAQGEGTVRTRLRRIVLLVFDSVGIGEMPDAADYGDVGSDTLGHIAASRPLGLPNLCSLGLANIRPFNGLEAAAQPLGCYGKCALASPGKDTTTGHWEMAGIHLEKPFPLYPHGFPPEVLGEFERRTGRRSLGNCTASGTEIIERLGAEHLRTGSPIVYTSADSVFQIAAHEEIIPVPELYRMCEIAREILTGPHEVGRVIARPFVGAPGAFVRDGATATITPCRRPPACCSTGWPSGECRSGRSGRSPRCSWAAGSRTRPRPATMPKACGALRTHCGRWSAG